MDVFIKTVIKGIRRIVDLIGDFGNTHDLNHLSPLGLSLLTTCTSCIFARKVGIYQFNDNCMVQANRQVWNRLSSLIIFLLVTITGMTGCRPSRTMSPVQTVQMHEDKPSVMISDVPKVSCVTMPADSFDLVYTGVRNDSIFAFYASHKLKPFWIAESGLTPKADSMISFIKSARFYGLLPQDYHVSEVALVRKYGDCVSLFRLDVLLTDAFLTMASDLKNGRLRKAAADPLRFHLLNDARTAGLVRIQLESQEPKYTGYKHLKAALRNVLDTVSHMHRSLFLSGVISDSLPANRKIQTLEINLERWRWEKNIPGNYVWVNIPAFRVSVFEDDSVVLESKVIVGAQDTPTPVLSSNIECFIVYPYWHVPRKIAVEEYLPVIKQDISFLASNNFEVLDRKGNVLGYDSLDWLSFNENYFPVTLRQREGTDNALGVVKFSFDNRYAVYLHDTNAKRLFQRNKRALSHGCIRMEKAVDFAHYLAETYTKKYSSEDVDRYIRLKQKHTVDLATPLPIYLRYFTCESDGNSLRIFEDIYSRDRYLISSFYKSSVSF